MVRLTSCFPSLEPSPPAEPVQNYPSVKNDFSLFLAVNSEKEPDYRDVSIRTDVKVKELYDVEERLGT